MSRSVLTSLVVSSLVAGVALMVGFDSTATRALGIACLVGFVAGGLFLIADPRFLAGDE
jgi:hypothetical protein